jgi:hypothetical protein
MAHRITLLMFKLSSITLISFATADVHAGIGLSCESAQRFQVSSIYMERNDTDDDVEVVVQVKGGDTGIRSFLLMSPTGKIIYQLSAATDARGVRELEFESPEPSDIELVKAAYPEGPYSFHATTVDGQQLCGSHWLTHTLPKPALIVAPSHDEIVPLESLTVVWIAVSTATGYTLELENERSGQELSIQISAEETTFSIPAEWLEANTSYKIGVMVKNQDGNKIQFESSFSTSIN